MWIALWFVLSAFVMGVFVWSLRILIQQKRAWAAYAKKRGYEYIGGKMMDPPAVVATVNGMRLSLYTDIQRTNDVRAQRYVTIIEIVLGSGMPTGAAIATKELRPFIDSLNFTDSHTPPDFPEWSPSYIVKTRDTKKLAAYLTQNRLAVLHSLFSMKNSMALFFFDEEECVLRIETPDPLRNVEHLEKIVRRIVDAVEKLRLTEQEKAQWQAQIPPPPPPSQPGSSA